MRTHTRVLRALCLGALVIAAAPWAAWAHQGAQQPADQPPLLQEELDQMLAPIALYPDALLSQVFMASTYPLEVVQADRWVQANPNLQGDALAMELEQQTWDPSVKSLVNFPEVLSMLSEQLDMTVKIGDAFLGQQEEVMATVQALRAKAAAEGSLTTTNEQTVTTEEQTIVIESADPEVIYVPTYDSTVVYGSWPYPAYPPYTYYTPTPTPHPGLRFAAGVAIGAAWGYAWGHCDWGHGDIDIDVNRNINVNNRIDRSRYSANVNRAGGTNSWRHDPVHRQGTPYRNQAVSQRYGGASSPYGAQTREAYRGRAEGGGASRPSGTTTHSIPASANRSGSTAQRSNTGGAFDGMDRSGSSTRAQSQRGSASRSSAGHSGGARGGGGRGGGGRGR